MSGPREAMMANKMAFQVRIGNSAAIVHDVFVVIATSADEACAKLKKSVALREYADGTIIVEVKSVGGTVIE